MESGSKVSETKLNKHREVLKDEYRGLSHTAGTLFCTSGPPHSALGPHLEAIDHLIAYGLRFLLGGLPMDRKEFDCARDQMNFLYRIFNIISFIPIDDYFDSTLAKAFIAENMPTRHNNWAVCTY